MDDLDKIIAKIRRPIAEGRMTKAELARRAGLPQTTLICLERSTWNPRAVTIKRLLAALVRRGAGQNPRSSASSG